MPNPRPLKLYSWIGFHPDSPDRHRQCCYTIAAHSKVEARRQAGHHVPFGSDLVVSEPVPDSLPALNPGVLYWTMLLPESDPCPACGGRGYIPRPPADTWRMAFGEEAAVKGGSDA